MYALYARGPYRDVTNYESPAATCATGGVRHSRIVSHHLCPLYRPHRIRKIVRRRTRLTVSPTRLFARVILYTVQTNTRALTLNWFVDEKRLKMANYPKHNNICTYVCIFKTNYIRFVTCHIIIYTYANIIHKLLRVRNNYRRVAYSYIVLYYIKRKKSVVRLRCLARACINEIIVFLGRPRRSLYRIYKSVVVKTNTHPHNSRLAIVFQISINQNKCVSFLFILLRT